MTSREIMLANLNHENPSRPGFTFSGERLNDTVMAGISPANNWQQKRWKEGKFEYYDDEWGNIWSRIIGLSAKGEIHQPVLTDWDELDSYQIPDYDDPMLYDKARQAFASNQDRFKLGFVGGWIFNDARYMRKMEVYFMDLIEYRKEIDKLHQLIMKVYETKIRHMGDAGADGILFLEDLGTQTGPLIGPDMWRDMFKPLYQHLTGLAHSYGMKVLMHSCGYNWVLIDELCQAGIDCFQFDQPSAYDMAALAEKLKQHKAALWSPVDVQKVLPTGDRKFIESEAARLVELFEGFLIVKDYPDLHGIGVKPEWDQWAYAALRRASGLTEND